MSTLHRLPSAPQAEGDEDLRRTYFTNEDFIDEWVQDYTGRCFFCDKDLELPAIMWKIASGSVWFHANCAERFALCLLKDAARVNYIHKEQLKRTVGKLTGEVAQ